MRVRPPIDTPEKLRRARKELGLTQKALATQIGVTRNAVIKMEAGDRTIARRTDYTMRYLLLTRPS